MRPFPIGTIFDHNQTLHLPPEHKRRHVAIFGKSGVGKARLLRNMIEWDVVQNVGVTVIDPHGGPIDAILDNIPRHRTNDVVYFDPRE